MNRAHDVGGMPGFGPIQTSAEDAPFHHEWEARVFAINQMLLRANAYNLDEFRDAIEGMEPAAYRAASYYERWLYGIETLVARKGLLR